MTKQIPELDQEEIDAAIRAAENIKALINEEIKNLKAGTVYEKVMAWNLISFLTNTHNLMGIFPILLNSGYHINDYLESEGDEEGLGDINKIEKHPIFKRHEAQFEQMIKQFGAKSPFCSEHNQELARKLADEMGVSLDE